MNNEIINDIELAFKNNDFYFESYSEGQVISYSDGIVLSNGLETAKLGEIVEIYTEYKEIRLGIVFNLEEEKVGIIVLFDHDTSIKVGNKIKTTGNIFTIEVSEAYLGRTIDIFGNPIDGLGKIKHKNPKEQKVERKAYDVLSRQSVNEPLETGILAIDTLIPIGRGQRELIIGDRQTGKTSLALDIIVNQAKINKLIDKGIIKNKKKVYCIYVAIGQKQFNVAQLRDYLIQSNALDYTIIIAATSSELASRQYLAPFIGTAIGEFFMEKGDDALIVYDDLSKHAKAYRQLSLLLKRPPGREAYPGDIFYLHSRLLERSGKLNNELGGGSLTALPIIETLAGDISAYIPTNVISITDGQIYLKSELFNNGIRPAIDIGNSVSRVGGSAQTKATKQVAGQLKLNLAQFRELQTFIQFGVDVDKFTKEKLELGLKLTEALKQNIGQTYSMAEQVLIIWAIINKYADNLSYTEIIKWRDKLLDFFKNYKQDILNIIIEEQKISPETEEKFKKYIEEFQVIYSKTR